MKADKELLLAMMDKLNGIAERTNDIETEAELDEFVQVLADTIANM